MEGGGTALWEGWGLWGVSGFTLGVGFGGTGGIWRGLLDLDLGMGGVFWRFGFLGFYGEGFSSPFGCFGVGAMGFGGAV